MGERIRDWILDFILDVAQGLVEAFVEFLENILFNYEGLAGIALDAFNFFVWFSGLLLVVICLAQVINQLLSEGEGSQEANIWHTIIGSVKAGALLVIMPFAVSFTMNNFIAPISQYFIDLMGVNMLDNLENMLGSTDILEGLAGTLIVLIIWIFVAVVFGFFIVKVFISQANMLILEILSPLVAVSVVNDKYDYTSTWTTDIISHTVTLIVLTLTMALFAESLTVYTDEFWTQMAYVIGSGALVISGPTLIKQIKFSSGVSRGGSSAVRQALHLFSHRK